MENLNVLKQPLSPTTVDSAMESTALDVTGCGGLAFQITISGSSGISGASVKIQKSLDAINWVNDIDVTAINGNGTLFIDAQQPLGGNFYRLVYAISAGSFVSNVMVLGKTFGGTQTSAVTTGGGGGGGGSGTVTSVAMSVPSTLLAISGSPITSSGTLAVSLPTRAANLCFSGPTTGSAAAPTFRSLVAADIPNLDASKITTGTLAVARGGTNSSTALNNNSVMISSGGAIVEATAITASRALVSDTNGIPVAATTTTTQVNYVAGLGTLSNNRIIVSSGSTIIEASAITAARALISDANGIPTQSTVTSTELALLSGKTSVGDFSGPGSSTANAIVRFSGTGGKTGLDSAVTIADTTGAMSWPATAVHRSIYIPGGTLTNASDNFIEITGTFNTAGANYGINTVMTTSGSSGSSQYFGQRSRLAAGYTGTGWVVGHLVQNLVAGTGTDTFGSGNVGYYGFVTGSTVGTNTSFAAVASSATRNIGFAVAMDSAPAATNGRNIGLYAAIDPGNNASQRNCCAFLTLTSSSSSTLAPPQTGALVVSNGSSSFDAAAFYDASALIFQAKHGGDVATGTQSIITSANTGFLFIPSAAGAPSGTPTAPGTMIPLYYDATGNFLYVYNSGWKKTTVFA